MQTNNKGEYYFQTDQQHPINYQVGVKRVYSKHIFNQLKLEFDFDFLEDVNISSIYKAVQDTILITPALSTRTQVQKAIKQTWEKFEVKSSNIFKFINYVILYETIIFRNHCIYDKYVYAAQCIDVSEHFTGHCYYDDLSSFTGHVVNVPLDGIKKINNILTSDV